MITLRVILPLILAVLNSSAFSAIITTQNFGPFSMDFATVRDAGNAGDSNANAKRIGRGSVATDYKIGVNEVSEGMINAYNADIANASNLISLRVVRGDEKPAALTNWYGAARFVNWLNSSQGQQEAYRFTSNGPRATISLWDLASAGAGFNANNLYRNSLAKYWLPSEDEWYKAAYYSGSGSDYTLYATGSDSAPTPVSGGTTAGSAAYLSRASTPADTTNAGGLSFYGTMAQSGNVREWTESAEDGVNNTAEEERTVRGGTWRDSSFLIGATYSLGLPAAVGTHSTGFRVAGAATPIPEPSALLLTSLGALSLLARRKS